MQKLYNTKTVNPQNYFLINILCEIFGQSDFMAGGATKSNQITFIVKSQQHMCLGEWNSWERAPDSAETIYI